MESGVRSCILKMVNLDLLSCSLWSNAAPSLLQLPSGNNHARDRLERWPRFWLTSREKSRQKLGQRPTRVTLLARYFVYLRFFPELRHHLLQKLLAVKNPLAARSSQIDSSCSTTKTNCRLAFCLWLAN